MSHCRRWYKQLCPFVTLVVLTVIVSPCLSDVVLHFVIFNYWKYLLKSFSIEWPYWWCLKVGLLGQVGYSWVVLSLEVRPSYLWLVFSNTTPRWQVSFVQHNLQVAPPSAIDSTGKGDFCPAFDRKCPSELWAKKGCALTAHQTNALAVFRVCMT